jgi:hypothetical protein
MLPSNKITPKRVLDINIIHVVFLERDECCEKHEAGTQKKKVMPTVAMLQRNK